MKFFTLLAALVCTLASKKGKTDYNFVSDTSIYDGADWSKRKSGQPFVAQIQRQGGKTRDIPQALAEARGLLGSVTPPKDLPLPPCYPFTLGSLEDWAATLLTFSACSSPRRGHLKSFTISKTIRWKSTTSPLFPLTPPC